MAYTHATTQVKKRVPVKTGQPPVICIDNPVLAGNASKIRNLGKRLTENIVEIGRLLSECKTILGHGNWLPWIEREFGWTDRTAERFMQVYRLSGKFDKMSNLEVPITGLYLLAAPSTPEEACTEVVARVGSGEKITNTELKEIIGKHKAPAVPAQSPPFHLLRPAWADGKPPVAQIPTNAPISSPRVPAPYTPLERPDWAQTKDGPGNSTDEASEEVSPNVERKFLKRLKMDVEDALILASPRFSKLTALLRQTINECDAQFALIDAA
jgi:hypothetical protein